MVSKAVPVLLFLVGVINFLPVMGLLSAEKLSGAYSVDLLSEDLVILMRHRALLFGIVGGFVLVSVFVPSYQPAAMVMAAISMVGFLFFVWDAASYNQAIAKVAMVDVVGIVLLITAVVIKFTSSEST